MKRIILSIALVCITQTISADHPVRRVDKVILWGHKLHSHTHSYIHWGLSRAFKHLGFDTYWFDNKDDVSSFDFSNSLFITEGQVDQNIPVRNDCYYVIHNCKPDKYQHLLNTNHAIILQVYSHDCLKRNDPSFSRCFHYDLSQPVIYMPWATDLLPHEIDKIKTKLPTVVKNNTTQFNGSAGGMGGFGNQNQLNAFRKASQEQGKTFVIRNAGSCSMEENIASMQQAYMAPALQGTWQCENGYIPCRIFKNISYGALGITNSKAVYDLFEGKIVYNSDPYQLFYDAQKVLQTWSLKNQYELMDLVRDKHTYLNRIESLFSFFEMVQNYKNNL
jgi:hypothetical protein